MLKLNVEYATMNKVWVCYIPKNTADWNNEILIDIELSIWDSV